MGRNFGTKEDIYSELDETFTVRFENSVDYGHDGESVITIKDDDGVGIYDLEITSVPDVIWSVPNGGGSVRAYTTGDVIEVTARFTDDVTNVNPDTGRIPITPLYASRWERTAGWRDCCGARAPTP